jgi:hypothetical protein
MVVEKVALVLPSDWRETLPGAGAPNPCDAVRALTFELRQNGFSILTD